MPSGGQQPDIVIAIPTHDFNPLDQAVVILCVRDQLSLVRTLRAMSYLLYRNMALFYSEVISVLPENYGRNLV